MSWWFSQISMASQFEIDLVFFGRTSSSETVSRDIFLRSESRSHKRNPALSKPAHPYSQSEGQSTDLELYTGTLIQSTLLSSEFQGY